MVGEQSYTVDSFSGNYIFLKQEKYLPFVKTEMAGPKQSHVCQNQDLIPNLAAVTTFPGT